LPIKETVIVESMPCNAHQYDSKATEASIRQKSASRSHKMAASIQRPLADVQNGSNAGGEPADSYAKQSRAIDIEPMLMFYLTMGSIAITP
jgi:hypothetical protein